MVKKLTHQLGIVADFLQLFVHTLLQLLAFFQRLSGYACTFCMTPHQFIRIQVWRIAGQKVQRQTTLSAGHIFLNHRLLVCWQSINHQMQWFLAAVHQLLEQFNKQFAGQPTLISGKPERAFGIDRRGYADALALPRSIDHRRFAPLSPSLAKHRIGTKARLVPERDFSAFCFGLLRNGRKDVTLPTLNGVRIALVGTLQWLLRREVEFREQTAHRGHAQADVEFLENQLSHDSSRPQGKVKAILHRILAIDPAKHLLLLSAGELGCASRALTRNQTMFSATPSAHIGKPLVSHGATQSIAVHHHRNIFSLNNALRRHHAYGFLGLSIMSSPIFFHEQLEFA